MRATVARTAFKAAAEWVARAGSATTPVRLTVEGETLTLEATDGLQWRRTQVDIEPGAEPGSLFTPVLQLTRVLGVSKAKTLELWTEDEDRLISAKVGVTVVSLGRTLEPDTWRDMPDYEIVAITSRSHALWALKAATSVMLGPKEPGNDSLKNVQIRIKGNEMTALSSNTYRVIELTIPARGKDGQVWLVDPTSLLEALPILGGDDVSFITNDRGQLGVTDGRSVALAVGSAETPIPLQKVLDKCQTLSAHEVMTDKVDLISALSVASLGTERFVTLAIESSEIEVSSVNPDRPKPQVSTAVAAMATITKTLKVDPHQLNPLLAAVRTSTVVFRLAAEGHAAILVCEDDTASSGARLRAAIMPIRDGSL